MPLKNLPGSLSDLNPSLSYHSSFVILPNWQPQRAGHCYIFNKFWINTVKNAIGMCYTCHNTLFLAWAHILGKWRCSICFLTSQMTSHLVYCYLTSYLTVVQFRQSHEQSPSCAVQTPYIPPFIAQDLNYFTKKTWIYHRQRKMLPRINFKKWGKISNLIY